MKNAWKKIERYLADAQPDLHEALRPPAEAASLAAVEAALGVSLPEALRESLSLHDGMHGEALFELWRLLPAEEIVQQWRSLVHLLDAGELDGCVTEHDEKLQDGWFRRGWIPFAADGFGNLLCIDVEPGPRGKAGQLVVFWHDDAERKVHGANLLAWMRLVARELPKQEASAGPTPVVIGDQAFRHPKAAQIRAVRGDTDVAMAALQRFHEQGDASAAASLALLHAFRGQWDRVLELSAFTLAHTDEFHHMNVPFEHCALLVRAGVHTGRWDEVKRVASAVPKGRAGNGPQRAIASAEAKEDRFEVESTRAPASEDDDAAAYARYLREGPPSTYSATETQRRRHHFLMTINYRRWDEARRLFAEHPEACQLSDAIRVVPHLPEAERWPMLRSSLARWYPVYYAQVAPAELLTTPIVRDVMTPARCEELLATPRVHHWWDFRSPA